MAAVAHGWKPPAESKVEVPVEIAKDFNDADVAKAKQRQMAAIVMKRRME